MKPFFLYTLVICFFVQCKQKQAQNIHIEESLDKEITYFYKKNINSYRKIKAYFSDHKKIPIRDTVLTYSKTLKESQKYVFQNSDSTITQHKIELKNKIQNLFSLAAKAKSTLLDEDKNVIERLHSKKSLTKKIKNGIISFDQIQNNKLLRMQFKSEFLQMSYDLMTGLVVYSDAQNKNKI